MPRVKLEEGSVSYRESGHPKGHLVLFHHGWCSSSEVWGRVIYTLNTCKQQLRCIALDARGSFGAACRPTEEAEYTIEHFAKDAMGLVDTLVGTKQKFSFVGHSMGGAVGMCIAAMYPNRLARLVLVASVPLKGLGHYPDKVHQRNQKIRYGKQNVKTMLADALLWSPAGDYGREGAQHSRSYYYDRRAEEALKSVRTSLGATDAHFEGAWNAMTAFNKHKSEKEDMLKCLREFKVPVLVVLGDCDQLCMDNMEDYMSFRRAKVPVSLCALTRVGHSVPKEAPERLARAIDDFLYFGAVNEDWLTQRYVKWKKQTQDHNSTTTAQVNSREPTTRTLGTLVDVESSDIQTLVSYAKKSIFNGLPTRQSNL